MTSYEEAIRNRIAHIKEIAESTGATYEQVALAMIATEVDFVYERLGDGIATYEGKW